MTDERDSAHVHFSRARLHGHLDGQGVSLDELAARANLPPELCAQINRGGRGCELDPEQIEAIAKALQLQPADLHGTGEWADDYISTVLPYMPPMSEEDIARAAAALTRTGPFARSSRDGE